MSRIVLTRWSSGQERVVVGWDHAVDPPGAYFQEFAEEPADGDYPVGWDEMLREGGFTKGIALDDFRGRVPEDLQPLITDRVMGLLAEHAADLDSGYNTAAIDLTAA